MVYKMRNYFILILLAAVSVVTIATYDFGKPDVPYTHYDDVTAPRTQVTDSTAAKKDAEASKLQAQSRHTSVNPIYKMQLELAVVAARTSAECGNDTVGYRHLQAKQAASELVNLMNSTGQPVAGESDAPKPAVKYVLNKPDAPWQVVIRADKEAGQLVIEGYGIDLKSPLFSEVLSCS